jgi:hypothetical protein
MTSAKNITITPGVMRLRKPVWPDERCRSGIFRLDGERHVILTGMLNVVPESSGQ